VEPDRIEDALAGLGPEARALVELSLIREVADEDIASLLGTDEDAVRGRREDALAVLAADLGASSSDEVGALVREMRELPNVRWRDKNGEPARQPAPGPEPAPAPEAAPAAEPPPPVVQPGAKRNRRLAPALLGGLLVAAVVALALALSGGGDDEDGGEPAREAAAPAAGKGAKLAPPGGGTGMGTAVVRGGRLELSASGLPDPGGSGYAVWLYNSLSEARPLNRPQSTRAFELKTRLPKGANRYRFVDVSLEPADGNDNHSGQSVLRVPLSSLR